MGPDREKSLTTRELWTLLLLQSAVLVGLGLILTWWLQLRIDVALPGLRDVLLAVALVAPLLLTSMLLLAVSRRYARAMELLERILGPPMRPQDIPALALVSAAVEEYFFRGVLQPILGPVPAALAFGLAHVWNRHLLIHGAWAAAAGLYLGLEYQMTGNLCLPIITHAFNNLVGLGLLKRGTSRLA
jgi:membrane protease YdiL (CAAX protease family)